MRHAHLTDDLQEQASLYAAGAMTESERAEYARHLEDDNCAVCRAEVKELEAAMSMMAFTAPGASPSPAVRERLMEQARSVAQPRREAGVPFLRRRWAELITSTAAIGAIVVALAATRANDELRNLAATLSSRVAQLEVQLARNQNYVAELTALDSRVVDLAGQNQNVNAVGRIFIDASKKKWRMYVKNLPPVSADKAYELWFVPKTGSPQKALVFNTEGSAGVGELEIDVPEGLDLKAAAVTIEPAGGTDLPTGPFALLGTM